VELEQATLAVFRGEGGWRSRVQAGNRIDYYVCAQSDARIGHS